MSPTSYIQRTVPNTSYSIRPIIQTFDWITWAESTDTWASVTETWDTYYSGIILGTQYSNRTVPNTTYTARVTP